MKLFSYSNESNNMNIGVETPDGTFNFTRAFDVYQKSKRVTQPVSFSFIQVMVELGYFSASTIKKVLEDAWVQSKRSALLIKEDIRKECPIARPSKIIGIGRNYRGHAKEMNNSIPEEPIFFSKSTSSLLSHDSDILIPSWFKGRVDHEAELAVVIGKAGKDIPENKALAYIAGYSIFLDMTARSMQKEDLASGQPWFRSKSFDTFGPFGPYLVPADHISDPHQLDISLTVNGEERQSASTSQMIFSIPKLISYISRFMTLFPGDIIATGTPEGVGPVKNNDVIEVSITNLGMLRSHVITAE